MSPFRENKGRFLFILIALFVLAGAFIAYQAGGPADIEERFHTVAGMTPGASHAGEENTGGFFIEGNSLLYILIFILLIGACVLLYQHYHI